MPSWYIPQGSSFAADIDNLILLVGVIVGVWFVAAELIFFGLIGAMLVHFGVGFAMPRQETFALLAFPPFLALVGPGVSSLLWVPLVMMMVFPGAPLVLLGLWLRNHLDPKEVEDYLF